MKFDNFVQPMSPEEQELAKQLSQGAVLPQSSLEGNSPRAMPNFANAQEDPVVFMNNLFKDTPAFDPRVQPMKPDQMNMEEMTINGQGPDDLKAKLEKFKALRAPASEAPVQAQMKELPKEKTEDKKDDLYMNQGISKILQGLSTMGGGKIDDNADFYNQYRQHQLNKPLQELEAKVKQRNYERMSKMDDPNSQESVNMRKALSKLAPDLVTLYGQDWDKISANDKDSIFDIIKTREQIEGRKEAARLASQQRADAKEDLNFRKDQARQDKLNQQAKLSEKQVNDLTKLDQAIDLMDNISATKPEFDTGPVSGRQNTVAGWFGLDDAKKSAFKADVQTNVAEYIKNISGAAVSDQERAYLLQNMPNMNDNDATFQAKLDNVRNRIKKNRETFLKNIKTSGKNTAEFDRPSDTKPSEKSHSNEVERIDSKTGKTAIFDAQTKQFLRWK